MTVDIDSTVITRYGKQELGHTGYNPAKPGRASHHPLMAFCEELKMVINAWMRSGDSHSGTDVLRFLEELFTIVSRSRIGLLRGDSGFFDGKLLTLLEGEQGEKDPALTQGVLFEAEADWQRYEYKAFVTNTEDSAASIHRRYNQRADCENRIKELKYDYSIDGFALQSFAAVEAAFRWIMVAYNLMSLFRQKVMTSPKAPRLSTIRFQCIAIGSYLVKSGRKKKLKLSAEGRRRHFLEHFFTNLEELRPPFRFSIA